MKTSQFIEQEFIKFYDSINTLYLTSKEIEACDSFYDLCLRQTAFTEKQANYLKAILKKYYPEYDKNLKFRHPFRLIDDSKKVYIDDTDNKLSISFKFPYSFLEKFDSFFIGINFDHSKISYWDNEQKARKIDFIKANFLKICEFVNQYDFQKDESFSKLEYDLQQALNEQDNIIPYSIIENDSIKLKNADPSAIEYFETNKLNDVFTNAFIAKTMGFPISIIKKDKSVLEKIISSKNQFFWMKQIEEFINLIDTVKTKTCIVLDRDEKEKEWLNSFVEIAKKRIPQKKIRVCFRETQEKDPSFNNWVKENNLGGKVDDGDLYIFQYKPPKWILKHRTNMLFIATTMINPPSNTMTQDFFTAHPCVIHLGDIRPTIWRNKTIVEL